MATMTRRHYRILAEALHSAGVDPQDRVLTAILTALRYDNPRFSAQRFREWVEKGDDGTRRRFPGP